VLGERRLTAM